MIMSMMYSVHGQHMVGTNLICIIAGAYKSDHPQASYFVLSESHPGAWSIHESYKTIKQWQ